MKQPLLIAVLFFLDGQDLIAGIQPTPASQVSKIDEHVSIIPNIQAETYDSLLGRSYDPSITTRVTLHYVS